MQKAAHLLGMGTNNLVKVRTDKAGRMEPEEFRRTVLETRERGLVPLIVNATAGTTVLGAFDPFDEIADICREFGIWMHVDVSYFVTKYAHIPECSDATHFSMAAPM